jgi:hypothetical protein
MYTPRATKVEQLARLSDGCRQYPGGTARTGRNGDLVRGAADLE